MVFNQNRIPLAGNFTTKERIESIRAAFASGLGYRATARETGVSRQTLRRLESLGLVRSGTCGCGQLATHNGWCSWRYQRSTARQEWMASFSPNRNTQRSPRVLLHYPYFGREDDLVKAVYAAAPTWWPQQLTSEVCQETISLLLDGSFPIDDLPSAMKEGTRRIYALFPTHRGAPRSLSTPRSDEDERTLSNSIRCLRPLFTFGEIVREKNGGVSPIQYHIEQDNEIDPEIMDVMLSDIHPRWFRPLAEA